MSENKKKDAVTIEMECNEATKVCEETKESMAKREATDKKWYDRKAVKIGLGVGAGALLAAAGWVLRGIFAGSSAAEEPLELPSRDDVYIDD